MDLRSYRLADLDALHKIDQECFLPEIAYSRDELEGFIRHRRSRTWVAEESGEIVGFLVAGWQPRRVGHIVTLDVVQRWRRHGIGKSLMAAAEEWARHSGLDLIYLETAENNDAAQRFYEALGYRKADKIENYYADGLAAWVMVNHLK